MDSDYEYDSENEFTSENHEDESDLEAYDYESDSDDSTAESGRILKEKIFLTLKQVKTPSAFAYSAIDWCLPNPGLYLLPYGTLGLPLSIDDAQKIVSQASQLPFGSEETLKGNTVRKSWELNPKQFSLRNPGWNTAMKTILDSVMVGLGLGKGSGKVTAQLHKLVLHGPGACFKRLKVREKTPRIFATLVVCLPSPHEGGKLVLTHDNEKYEFETAGSSSFGCSYAVWYSGITHKALPVVSGHRLVLTYGLIRQTDFVVPSYDLVRWHMEQLSTLLEEYNSRLREGDKKLPPILLHKLEHKYPQAKLKLSALKPPDIAQVQVLRQLSTELGFDIYLASLRLIIWSEELDNSGIQERTLELRNVVELDGTLLTESLDYPAGALTAAYDREVDETIKEEFVGSGTVVVLLPPSKQLNFVFKFTFDGSVVKPLFWKLMQEFSQDPAQQPKLEQLCKLALKQKPRECWDYQHHQYSNDIPPYFKQAVATALDLGHVGLFDDANKTMCDTVMLNDARKLGRSTAKNGVTTMTDRLMDCVQIISSIAKKVEFLEAVAKGFETATPQPSSAERASLKQRSDEAILSAVAKLTTLTTADAVSLARLCKNVDWSLFESKAKQIIIEAAVMTKITFIDELISTMRQELDKEQQSFMAVVIRSIWNEFVFEAKSNELMQPVSLSWFLSDPDDIVALNENNVLDIVKTTIKILSSKSVEKIIIPAMLTAIPTASKKCAKELFVPLVQMILTNKLTGFKLATSNTGPPPSHKRLVQALLVKYLLDHIDPKPQPPTDWSVPARSCKCTDCSLVNRFLQDPCQESLDFPCGGKRRNHLDQIFNDDSRSFYDIATIRGTSPCVWRITKHLRSYKEAKSEWEKNTRIAVQPLLALKNEEPVKGRLEAYLQPYYNIIMNANVKRLPDLKYFVLMPQSSENNENAASALNQSPNQTGLKRAAGDASPSEDNLAKQPRSQVPK